MSTKVFILKLLRLSKREPKTSGSKSTFCALINYKYKNDTMLIFYVSIQFPRNEFVFLLGLHQFVEHTIKGISFFLLGEDLLRWIHECKLITTSTILVTD